MTPEGSHIHLLISDVSDINAKAQICSILCKRISERSHLYIGWSTVMTPEGSHIYLSCLLNSPFTTSKSPRDGKKALYPSFASRMKKITTTRLVTA